MVGFIDPRGLGPMSEKPSIREADSLLIYCGRS